MYKCYKHKLNLLVPGGILAGISGVCFLLGILSWCFDFLWLRDLLFATSAILAIVLFILVLIEQHEDKVLNEQALRLEQKLEAGIQKKSFVLNYNGAELWCEHLDSMGDYKQKVLEKFHKDMEKLDQITMPTLVAVNLDETMVDRELLDTIVKTFCHLKQPLRKVVFVGLSRSNQRIMKRVMIEKQVSFLYQCINDFEKAKEWLL